MEGVFILMIIWPLLQKLALTLSQRSKDIQKGIASTPNPALYHKL